LKPIQVAPHIAPPRILIQTRLKNYGPPCSAVLDQKVKTWKGNHLVTTAAPLTVDLAASEEKVLAQTVAIPEGRLWSPENPFLYQVETSTAGDSVSTRFGLREFRSEAKRFYLNGKVYYLRGSNITLHRFFEDPGCGNLPWKEEWVRKLLITIPHRMHWNSFRFCIGPVPDRWLEIADEAGLLIQNEFFVWTGAASWDTNYARHWDAAEMVRQYGDWMRDNWNHPSVAIWDANNETLDPIFGERIIPAVRPLDLSHRPWENSYNPPADPNDPIEHHPYQFQSSAGANGIRFRLTDLETKDPRPSASHIPKESHPILINEYGWLWLNRDGSPTVLTEKLYPRLLGTNSTAEERFAFDAYALAGKTEFWRASRQYAGVLHFVYLTCSYPGVFTSDHFRDVKKLKLEPHFSDYMSEAFKPLGLYLNFFQPTLPVGKERTFTIKMVNDQTRPLTGDLVLALESKAGHRLAKVSRRFQLGALGDSSVDMPLMVPACRSQCILKVTAKPDGVPRDQETICRRWVTVQDQ
jgi:hypothetical protein